MAIHAAMIHRMDIEIGRVLDQIKAMGQLDNTLILFLSDNGASSEQILRGDGNDPSAPLGSAKSYLGLGSGWSSAANTPLRLHKSWTHEGGITTPLIVRWPAGIRAHGELRHDPGHLIDLVPTVLDVTGAKRPAEVAGLPVPPLPGKSLAPDFAHDGAVQRDLLWFYHDGHSAVRAGDWKLVGKSGEPWELYNLKTDRSETKNLAAKYPAKIMELELAWFKEADGLRRLAQQDMPEFKAVPAVTEARIVWRHILPNVTGTALVITTLQVGWAILNASALTFLGVGVPPGVPEWGAMLHEGRLYVHEAPWVAAAAGTLLTLTVLAVNLTGNDFKKLALSLTLAGPAGRVEASETAIVPELLPGVEKRTEHAAALAFPQNGVYRAEARISGEGVHAVGAAPITIVPTLPLRGNLQNTPAAAVICRPFAVRYSIRNAGNVPLSSGSATIEIGKAGAERPLITRQQAMGDWGKAIAIDTAALEPGIYTVSLKAAAANQQYGITREFTVAEQPLTMSPPIEVKRSDGALPRVLVWLGSEGPPVNRAVAGKIVAQALDEQDVYYKIAGTAEDFTTQAASGEFNTLILYEPAEMLDERDWLRARLAQGFGVVIAGESEAFLTNIEAPSSSNLATPPKTGPRQTN